MLPIASRRSRLKPSKKRVISHVFHMKRGSYTRLDWTIAAQGPWATARMLFVVCVYSIAVRIGKIDAQCATTFVTKMVLSTRAGFDMM